MIAHVKYKGFRIPNPGSFFLWDTESSKRLQQTSKAGDLESVIWHKESGIHRVKSRIQACIIFPYMKVDESTDG